MQLFSITNMPCGDVSKRKNIILSFKLWKYKYNSIFFLKFTITSYFSVMQRIANRHFEKKKRWTLRKLTPPNKIKIKKKKKPRNSCFGSKKRNITHCQVKISKHEYWKTTRAYVVVILPPQRTDNIRVLFFFLPDEVSDYIF